MLILRQLKGNPEVFELNCISKTFPIFQLHQRYQKFYQTTARETLKM